MLVSILQNGRKKDRQNSLDKINRFLKLTDKSSYTTLMTRSTIIGSSGVDDRRDSTKQKQNQSMIANRTPFKSRNNVSAVNILANRTNIMGTYLSNISDGQLSKKSVLKAFNEQSYSLMKQKKANEVPIIEKQKQQAVRVQEKDEKKSAYFFRILLKKNKLRSEFNMYIHNSIYTFRQFMRSCQMANPKPADTRIPVETQNRKTIVFDMDQTLIHTNQVTTPNYQIKVPFRSFQGRVGYGFVEVRPHCKDVLKRLSQHFDIIVFTASTQAYADPILDHIDPHRVIQHRLYRESCSLIKNQIFVKDLRVLGRKMQNIVLVDNAPYSYIMQLENAIPIIPYYRGKDDQQLLYLQQYLMKLKDVDDVRYVNRQYFKLHEYMKYDTHERLVNKLYADWIK